MDSLKELHDGSFNGRGPDQGHSGSGNGSGKPIQRRGAGITHAAHIHQHRSWRVPAQLLEAGNGSQCLWNFDCCIRGTANQKDTVGQELDLGPTGLGRGWAFAFDAIRFVC